MGIQSVAKYTCFQFKFESIMECYVTYIEGEFIPNGWSRTNKCSSRRTFKMKT